MRDSFFNKLQLQNKLDLPVYFLPNSIYFRKIGDRNGELTARMNVEQLMEVLGVSESDLSPSSSEFEMQGES